MNFFGASDVKNNDNLKKYHLNSIFFKTPEELLKQHRIEKNQIYVFYEHLIKFIFAQIFHF